MRLHAPAGPAHEAAEVVATTVSAEEYAEGPLRYVCSHAKQVVRHEAAIAPVALTATRCGN